MRRTGPPNDDRARALTGRRHSAEALVFALRLATQLALTLLIDRARSNRLKPVDLLILARATEGNGIVPGEIGAELGLRSSTMTTISNRLELKNLLRRLPHPDDGRLVLLKATPDGVALLDRALGPATAAVLERAQRLDGAEREVVVRFARDITALFAQELNREHLSVGMRQPPKDLG